MKFNVKLLNTKDRLTWIEKILTQTNNFMGDGIFDHIIMKKVGYAISKNALQRIKKTQSLLSCDGSDRTVAET